MHVVQCVACSLDNFSMCTSYSDNGVKTLSVLFTDYRHLASIEDKPIMRPAPMQAAHATSFHQRAPSIFNCWTCDPKFISHTLSDQFLTFRQTAVDLIGREMLTKNVTEQYLFSAKGACHCNENDIRGNIKSC